MNPEQLLKTTIKKLQREDCSFALAGGFVSSLYRVDIRATQDVDILLDAFEKTDKLAEKIIESLGMTAGFAKLSDLTKVPMLNKRSLPKLLVVGRNKNQEMSTGLDFILPSMPWAKNALERAQLNLIDFGFGEIPCLTVEDFIISKLYALKNDPSRFKDLDDLKSIFQSETEIDLDYLCAEMKRIKIGFPKELHEFIPKVLKVCSRGV